jgi:hypothetical protein
VVVALKGFTSGDTPGTIAVRWLRRAAAPASAVLARFHAAANILDTYNAERWPVGQKILHFSDRIFGVAISFGPFLTAVRNFALIFISKLVVGTNFGRRRMFGFMSQLNIHYHPNAVVQNALKSSRERKRVTAGRRAPDAPLEDGGSLFDLMRGYKFTLFVMSKAPIPREEQTQFERRWRAMEHVGSEADIHWIDTKTSLLSIKRYEVADVLVTLVRPDGYIGFQSDHLTL